MSSNKRLNIKFLIFYFIFILIKREFALRIKRPFAVRYNPYNQSIEILSNAQQVSNIVSDLRGDICIIFDALKKIEETQTEPNKQASNVAQKYQHIEQAFRSLSIDTI